MNIFIIAAWLAIPLSIWLIVYFGSRIITRYNIRKHLGDMPSAEEIQKHYQQNNDIIQYKQHSPTLEEKMRS
jgi:hypothetical protein